VRTVSEPQSGGPISQVKRGLALSRAYLPLTFNFAQRELKVQHKRSALGWAWSLLNPLSRVFVYSLVFGVIFRFQPPEGGSGQLNFAMYLFSGLIVWLLFESMIRGAMQWLISVGDLRRKVYFPLETVAFGGAAAVGFQAFIEALVLLAFMTAYGNVGWTLVLLPVVLLFAAMFGLGIGMVMAVFNTRYRDVENLVVILLSTTFFLVPIVYTEEIIPDEAYGLPAADLIGANPISQFVGTARDVVYFLEWPSVARLALLASYAFGSLGFGWWFLNRRSMALSEEM
jgi:ABC-type polysaccharide/polyol phosphate export permease